jgi:thiosulfate/3-mercaptopyruvate sulfurtransferase
VSDDEVAGFLAAQGFAPGDVDGADARGMTPLMHAAHRGCAAVARALIAAGARVDAQNLDGNQALWLACVGDDPEMVGLILAAGADVDHVNEAGATALMYAASAGKARALAALLAAGPRLEVEMGGLTALDMAATLECLQLLRAAQRLQRPDREHGPA